MSSVSGQLYAPFSDGGWNTHYRDLKKTVALTNDGGTGAIFLAVWQEVFE